MCKNWISRLGSLSLLFVHGKLLLQLTLILLHCKFPRKILESFYCNRKESKSSLMFQWLFTVHKYNIGCHLSIKSKQAVIYIYEVNYILFMILYLRLGKNPRTSITWNSKSFMEVCHQVTLLLCMFYVLPKRQIK